MAGYDFLESEVVDFRKYEILKCDPRVLTIGTSTIIELVNCTIREMYNGLDSN